MKLIKYLILFTLSLIHSGAVKAAGSSDVELKRGMIIAGSVKIKEGNYRLNGYDSLNRQVILINGNNITVDFNNAVLTGSINKQLPNEFYGLAILIKGNNITLKNARIHGYKVAVMAEGCKNLKIENSDFSYNYRQQLQSTWLHEDVSDWMSYHHNENDEWLRYGAGIYLKDCSKAVIQNNRISGGQCGLMMMRCYDGEITDNDFSFNSAIGIGMYRSSRNNVLHNKLDFNVRGYSHGFYNRGQDSAGILVFEQCNDNVFAYNSVTHSGDGFFLWAGQTTMDTGEGGCNDNYVFRNDFSYAPTNGVEITFSKNKILENIIKECDHGIWGGYSWRTVINGNDFEKNRIGIAIEHGQNNGIAFNKFQEDGEAIRLWARKTQPSDWGYANKRDTRSINYVISNNKFTNIKTALNFTHTDSIILESNNFKNVDTEVKKDSSVKTLIKRVDDFIGISDPFFPIDLMHYEYSTIPESTIAGGRDQMKITEWGPYNFHYPILFLKKIDSNNIYYFDVLGPKGKFKIKNSKDVSNISMNKGIFPAEITAQKNGRDVQLNLEYVGERFTDQFGKIQPGNKPYDFSFRDFQPEIDWSVNWYSWDKDHDPNKNYGLFKTVFNDKPLKSEQAKTIDYTWWGEIGKQLPADSFAIVATGIVEVEEGSYKFCVTADDLVKVFVDDKLVIDFWDASKYKYDEDTYHESTVKLNGKHNIRIEQVENTGYATLIFKIKPLKTKL